MAKAPRLLKHLRVDKTHFPAVIAMVNDSNIICGGDKRGRGPRWKRNEKNERRRTISSDLKRVFEEGKKKKSGEDTVVLVRSRLSTPSIDERGEESRFECYFVAAFESDRVSEVSRILAYRVRFHRALSKTLGHTSGMTRSRKSELYLSKC